MVSFARSFAVFHPTNAHNCVVKVPTSASARSIVFLTGQLGLGGAEKQLYLLAAGLIESGWRVGIITLHPGHADFWEEPLQRLGVTLHGVDTGLSRLQRLSVISQILRRERPEIVHSWTFHANLYAAIAGRSSGTRVRLGSERANHHCSREALGRFWYHLSLLGLDRLIVNSEPAARLLSDYRPQTPVAVVPNAVEIPAAPDSQPARQSRAAIRATLGVAESTCVVAGIGSLVQRKNFESLMDAVGLLLDKALDVALVVVGDGPLRPTLESKIDSRLRSRVLLPGPVANAADWYPAFDVVALSSRNQEGMPNVLMEASAAGLPVVSTHVGGVAAVVEDGITGYLVAPDDSRSLASALECLATNQTLRYAMGRRGRQKMQSEFGVGAMVSRMIAAYDIASAEHSGRTESREPATIVP